MEMEVNLTRLGSYGNCPCRETSQNDASHPRLARGFSKFLFHLQILARWAKLRPAVEMTCQAISRQPWQIQHRDKRFTRSRRAFAALSAPLHDHRSAECRFDALPPPLNRRYLMQFTHPPGQASLQACANRQVFCAARFVAPASKPG